ncbi:MAG TPA: Uma2 family endonuclease [Nitrospiraceae bacterium]|nr:Uma2 family endonuclease [Nitrospiraceae bacterium]
MVTETLIHKFNIETYHRLISTGILHEDDRVELIEGRIVDMTPIGTRHSACVNRLNSLFGRKLQARAIVSIQNPVLLLKDESEPEPDITLLKYREDFYSDKLPKVEDVLLLIEVADTSVEYDKGIKIPLYARANIQEVWLVNLLENSIEIFSSPSAGGYKFSLTVRNDQTISPKAFPDISLTAKQILG